MDRNAEKMREIFSKNLNFYIERSGKNQTDIARELDIPKMTMSNWVKAKTYPRPDKIQLLADYFNISRYHLTEEKPNNLQVVAPLTLKIPILGEIACGNPIYASENFSGFRYESPDNLPSGNLIYLEAKGDSMEPTIPDGSYVLIREQPEVEYGEIAAVLVNDDSEATLKRVRKQGEVVVLTPDNSDYEPIIVTEDNPVRIIGKAVRFTQDL